MYAPDIQLYFLIFSSFVSVAIVLHWSSDLKPNTDKLGTEIDRERHSILMQNRTYHFCVN